MSEKRVCVYCGKSMYTSLESVWVNGKNFNIHKKCKKNYKIWLKLQLEERKKEAKKNSNAKKRDKNITIKKEVKKNESCL